MAARRQEDGWEMASDGSVSRLLRRRLADSASEGGSASESGEAERRRSRRREQADEPPDKRRRLVGQLSSDRVAKKRSHTVKFRKLANITAKNKAAALLTKTGKKKSKPFKGLSYSFGRKKKKPKRVEPQEGVEPEIIGYVKELDTLEAKALEEDIGKKLEEAASEVEDELAASMDERSVDDELEGNPELDDAEVEGELDAETTEDLDDGALEELPGGLAEDGGELVAEGSEGEVDEEIEELVQDSKPADANKDTHLKGKARKSIPQVIMKKSFIPSVERDISPESSGEEFEDEEVVHGEALDDENSVASAVKLRRSSDARPAVPYSRMARGDSLTSSPPGSVTGGSGGGEAAPPEGTVPAKMMDSILKNIGCKCVETKTPAADLNLADKEHFCQGIDAIEGRLVGCCNVVVSKRLIRPSFKVPFLLMCGLHRERMRRHHCCPSCGVFCTQGIFMRCTHQCAPHLFHRKCAVQVGDMLVCSHCGNTDDLKMVQLTIRTGRTPTFYHLQGTIKKSRGARMAIGRERTALAVSDAFTAPPAYLSPYSLTLPDGRVLAANGLPVGPDRDMLERSLLAVTQTTASATAEAKVCVKDQLKALQSCDLEKLLVMLAQGCSPNQKYRECGQQTALHVVVQAGHVAAAHVLLTAGACLDPVDRDLQTPLMVAASRSQNEVLKYLVTAGAGLDAKGEDGMTPLHLAAQAGNIEGCHYLLSSGRTDPGYVNQQDDGGWTPVVWASEHKHPAVVRYLLQRGANPQLCDEEQNTGLHWAAFSGSMEIAELFLTAGCRVNSPNVHGDTPLHIASRQQHYQCVLLMLAHGANVYLRNREGMLALDCCGAERSESRLALLLNMELKQLASRAAGRSGERVLSNDISRGKEKLPIQAVNECDDLPLPTDYVYIAESCETMKLNIDKTITSLQSCTCLDNCLSGDCMCSQISLRCWYDPEGRLLPAFNYADPPMIFECNRACGCNQLTCNNRAVQHGITSRVQLYRTPDRGWGVRALKHIPKGSYVCEYVGELITDSAADQREDDSYLFDLDNRDGDTFCIDARRYGNVSRFINHRCQPNLVPVKVFVDHQDVRFPRIALFACRDVEPEEELGFDYGEKFWIIKYKMFTCKCGSAKCRYSSETIHLTLANYNKKLADNEKANHV